MWTQTGAGWPRAVGAEAVQPLACGFHKLPDKVFSNHGTAISVIPGQQSAGIYVGLFSPRHGTLPAFSEDGGTDAKAQASETSDHAGYTIDIAADL
jgi:hypothetical protein